VSSKANTFKKKQKFTFKLWQKTIFISPIATQRCYSFKLNLSHLVKNYIFQQCVVVCIASRLFENKYLEIETFWIAPGSAEVNQWRLCGRSSSKVLF